MAKKQKPIAFFSAEYAIEDQLPIYAGGLGVLSADFLLEAGDQGQPFVGIGVFYNKGFIVDSSDENRPKLEPKKSGFELVKKHGKVLKPTINIADQTLHFQAWSKQYGSATLYLLDCDIEENSPEQRYITSHLYEPDFNVTILQEVVLGIGGVTLLDELGIEPEVYHLNEGHTSFAGIALMAKCAQHDNHDNKVETLCENVKSDIVGTKHTVLPASGLRIPKAAFIETFKSYLEENDIDVEALFEMGKHSMFPDTFSGTQMMISVSREVNSVSKLHAVYEKRVHSNSDLYGITNGINRKRWQSQYIDDITNGEQIWQTHCMHRKELVEYLDKECGVKLDSDVLTVVWARRIAAYKRPDLIFSDLDRLIDIVNKEGREVQIIIAGRANKSDMAGQQIVKNIKGYVKDSRLKGRLVYLDKYDTESAQYLVKGADLWLNTPVRGQEASGTSGMKAGVNGVLNCSVSDGWIDEVPLNNIGWTLPEENTAEALYELLEGEIKDHFYNRDESGLPKAWIEMMLYTMDLIQEHYTTERMLSEYNEKLYKIN